MRRLQGPGRHGRPPMSASIRLLRVGAPVMSDDPAIATDPDDFAWDDLLDAIAEGKVLPVIGHELLEAEYDGGRTTLQRLVAQKLAASQGLPADFRQHFELSEAVAATLELPRTRPDDPYPQVARIIRNLNPPFPPPPALAQLAAIRPLDLFVSTTPDDLMAQALDTQRFRGAAVTRRLAYSVKQSTAALAEGLQEPRDGVPVVFNLLGRLSTLPEYALHDEDALEFIHGLISRDATPPEWLLSRLRDRVLLIIGLHLPDWLERFVLRSASSGRLRKADRSYFIARAFEPSASALALFFHRFGKGSRLNVYPGNAVDFVAELSRRWTARCPEAGAGVAAPPPAGRGSIFISYDWQNRGAVDRLHQAIVDLGGDAWFDRVNLVPGSDWEREIRAQIRHGVQLFVAVLSDQTENKPNSEGVVFAEWAEAVARASRVIAPRSFIVPVVVDADATEANPARYPKLMRAFPEFERFTFGLAPGGVPSPGLLAAVERQIELIRSAPR